MFSFSNPKPNPDVVQRVVAVDIVVNISFFSQQNKHVFFSSNPTLSNNRQRPSMSNLPVVVVPSRLLCGSAAVIGAIRPFFLWFFLPVNKIMPSNCPASISDHRCSAAETACGLTLWKQWLPFIIRHLKMKSLKNSPAYTPSRNDPCGVLSCLSVCCRWH